MKRLLLPALALLLAAPGTRAQTKPAAAKTAVGATKHALIVAVGAYPESSGWGQISSANDVPLVKAALLRQGFAEANIRVVADAAATKAGIVAELKALAGRVKPHDVVVFHYSGHGQQVADDNGDETDGLDEALVPVDAQAYFVPGTYEGQNHLRDEELGSLLGAVRQRLGPQGEVLAVLDACHSGTGTRGLARARGTQQPLVPPGFRPKDAACAQGCSFGAGEGHAAGPQAPMVCYFGASPSQLNFETTDPHGKGVGSLSLAFSNALTTATTAPTYETLFDRIKAEMVSTAPNQTPQVEGRTSAQVFRGRTVPVPRHYKPTAWLADTRLLIDGGTLQDLNEGTEVALYPPDTETGKGGKPLATGKVVASQLTTATVELTAPLTGSARNAWVVVTAHAFGHLSANLKLAVDDPTLKEGLLAALRQEPYTLFVKLVETGPVDLLVEQKKAAPPQLLTAREQLVYQPEAQLTGPAARVAGLLGAIKDAARVNFIRRLQTQAEGLGLELELVPVAVKKAGDYVALDHVLDPATKSDGTGGLVYIAGDYLQLKVTNTGRKKAYFTVLDIQPDNQLNVLLPTARPDDNPADYLLEPGQSRVFPNILQISPPYGQEVFKIVASATPLDLRALVTTRGASAESSRGTNPFAALVQESYHPGARGGAATQALPAESVSTFDRVFTIAAPVQP
ncbi:caspase family protein [Hymenobacter monticola]|uniref:Caspase family protein n=1 Tax=Hymenobacter monticola TaxID=1705399 RepID=A0ABY4B1L6_9BACT|nr:caspase family protein [Hymenobacter monticola]UOE33052.1 caspase family protein [Hymenobacter monticola]